MIATKDAVHVRMYNVGFGDCFLVSFPSSPNPLKVLIDCGTIAAASMKMTDVVQAIIDEVTEDDGVARIDLVVCTHRHADHVSGFADDRWKSVEVREVWMPWTEDPQDQEARRIRETQSKLALGLDKAWQAKIASGLAAAGDPSIRDIAINALSNASAMETLHKGFAGKPKRKFLSAPKKGLKTVKSTALGDVVTYVLGPDKSEAVIRDMDPPAGKTYLQQLTTTGEPLSPFEPFGPEWTLESLQYEWDALAVPPADAAKLRSLAELADLGITVSLDKAVNGTSLVLVFELGDAVLLFPGDAQWGTWNAILENEAAKELISRASFLKVGHHGSHNATPKEFVTNVMGGACCSMMSTKAGKWESIPRKPLVDVLRARTKFARSDVVQKNPSKPFMLSSTNFTEAYVDV